MRLAPPLPMTLVLAGLCVAPSAGCKARNGSQLRAAGNDAPPCDVNRDGLAEVTPETLDAAVVTRVKDALCYLYATQLKTDVITPELRLKGEWPSYVRGSIAPDAVLSALYDSNGFVPMFVVYPMFLVDDAKLGAGRQRVREMKTAVLELLRQRYLQSNGEVNFWPTYQGVHGPQQIFANVPIARLLGPVFDIANDADDTGVYYVTALKYQREFPGGDGRVLPDFPAIFARWLDNARVRHDAREDEWKAKATGGAFMTWLSNEDQPRNRQPINFFLPNNVDCTVVSNAMYAIGLGRKLSGDTADVPGYQESCQLARQAILGKLYPRCAFYYPPQWLFPYVMTRAYRDGGNTCLGDRQDGKPTLTELATQLLASQQQGGYWDDTGPYANLDGDVKARQVQFDGDAKVYSTALAVVSLLNMGEQNWPDKVAVAAAVKAGVTYLVQNSTVDESGRFWQGGVFFSSSYQAVARWKSRPYTTATVMEALIKYHLNYQVEQNAEAKWVLGEADVPSEWL